MKYCTSQAFSQYKIMFTDREISTTRNQDYPFIAASLSVTGISIADVEDQLCLLHSNPRMPGIYAKYFPLPGFFGLASCSWEMSSLLHVEIGRSFPKLLRVWVCRCYAVWFCSLVLLCFVPSVTSSPLGEWTVYQGSSLAGLELQVLCSVCQCSWRRCPLTQWGSRPLPRAAQDFVHRIVVKVKVIQLDLQKEN